LGLSRRPQIRIADEDVVKSEGHVLFLEADTTGGVALWIGINEKGLLLGSSEAGSQVHRRSRFANSALLVCNCDYSRHCTPW